MTSWYCCRPARQLGARRRVPIRNWIAIGLLFGIGALTVLLLGPYYNLSFRFDPQELLDQYVGASPAGQPVGDVSGAGTPDQGRLCEERPGRATDARGISTRIGPAPTADPRLVPVHRPGARSRSGVLSLHREGDIRGQERPLQHCQRD
jgi:hypothetical protein